MRAFRPVASITLLLAALCALSALWVTFDSASGCTVDGQACARPSPGRPPPLLLGAAVAANIAA